jgi:hypothetical protein
MPAVGLDRRGRTQSAELLSEFHRPSASVNKSMSIPFFPA